MRRKNTRIVQSQEKDFHKLEGRLQAALQPVNPRSEYVGDLRLRLAGQLPASQASPEKHEWSTVWIAASLLSGTFLIVLLIRAVIALFNWLHLIGGRVKNEPIAPLQPVV